MYAAKKMGVDHQGQVKLINMFTASLSCFGKNVVLKTSLFFGGIFSLLSVRVSFYVIPSLFGTLSLQGVGIG